MKSGSTTGGRAQLGGYVVMYPKDNPESWLQIYEFVDGFPEEEYWSEWKLMVRNVVSELEARGLVSHFRIGQSMHHIIFSTADVHELGAGPHVTLEFLAEESAIRVMYGGGNCYFVEPETEARESPSSAVPTILSFLKRLWIETKPGVEVPDVLSSN